jgi:hypothetical protein
VQLLNLLAIPCIGSKEQCVPPRLCGVLLTLERVERGIDDKVGVATSSPQPCAGTRR